MHHFFDLMCGEAGVPHVVASGSDACERGRRCCGGEEGC
jgi:hypothetical protein